MDLWPWKICVWTFLFSSLKVKVWLPIQRHKILHLEQVHIWLDSGPAAWKWWCNHKTIIVYNYLSFSHFYVGYHWLILCPESFFFWSLVYVYSLNPLWKIKWLDKKQKTIIWLELGKQHGLALVSIFLTNENFWNLLHYSCSFLVFFALFFLC